MSEQMMFSAKLGTCRMCGHQLTAANTTVYGAGQVLAWIDLCDTCSDIERDEERERLYDNDARTPEDDDSWGNRGGSTYRDDDHALYQRLDDGFRKAQYFARAGILALALLVFGAATAAAQNPAVSDSELVYVSRSQNADYTYNALVFPPIGTPEYSRSCYVKIAFEDHSAIAYCAEDGVTYHFDADGQYVPNIPANPVREPGWYPAP
jgi:hypothetical protein